MSAAEAAGYAMAVPEDMIAAEERELAEFAQRNRMILAGEPDMAAAAGTTSALRRLISDRGAWMHEWLQSRRTPA